MTTELSTGTVVFVDGSSASSAEPADELVVSVTEESPGLVADGSEPTVETGLEPEVVEPDVLPVDPESVPVVDDELVDSDDELDDSDDELDDSEDELDDSEDEFVDSDDELDDSDELGDEPESFGAANAAPIPPVPTNPTTPSEKANAPTRNACFDEFTCAPKRRWTVLTSAN